MAMLNIGGGNKDDALYRYKMPQMQTKTEGRGNGIKTNIENIVAVSKALGRPPSYTTKYFGCDLGAQSKFDDKKGVSYINGDHDAAKLAQLLDNFIKRFVQCYRCGNPETNIVITKSQTINLNCVACGFISEVDMRHKLTTLILKNPPKTKKLSRKAGSEEQKKLKKSDDSDDDVQWQTDTSALAEFKSS